MMINPRPDIKNWWAAEAMIASHNYVYQVTYKTEYMVHGPIGVATYDGAPIASFQYEFLALSPDVKKVMEAVLAYPVPKGKRSIIDVFHTQPSGHALREQYASYSHEFICTSVILGLDLPAKINTIPVNVYRATTLQQAEIANHSLTREGERIHVQTLRDKHIHSFYVEVDGEAVGWLQLVTVYPNVGYVNRLYVLEAFRKKKLGTALIQHAHKYAMEIGLERMVLIPSGLAIHLFRRVGYRPLLYFSAFRPAERT